MRSSLTVEDSNIDAEQINRYLWSWGIKNTVHPRGQGAVEEAARLKPDVILLDLNLPDQSGFDVLSELKADPRTRHIPVVIPSVQESHRQALASGAAGYLVKPFTSTEMRSELGRVTEQNKPPSSALTIVTHQKQPLVLVVDDNDITLEIVSDFLTMKQFRVAVAHSGLELLELLVAIRPDIILMDIQMPGMDGLEATRRVRANKDRRLAQVPIIALTALAMPGDQEMCIEAGVNDYMSKPVALAKLVERINALLQEHAE